MKQPIMTAPPPPKSASVNGSTATFGERAAKFLPPRIVLNAVEGWGKTSTAAYATKPAIIMARGDTGYDTLLGAGLVPSVPVSIASDWNDVLHLVRNFPIEERKVCVIDAMGGVERLMHEHVCQRDFQGDWSEKGFFSFQKGYDVSVNEWIILLQELDRLQTNGVATVILSHIQVKEFRNPMGADFDRYISDVHPKTWSATHKWADLVLFGTFAIVVDKVDKRQNKGKGIGGTQRVLYCERRDAFDAKNRYGMPAEIDVPDDPAQVWPMIINAMKGTV